MGDPKVGKYSLADAEMNEIEQNNYAGVEHIKRRILADDLVDCKLTLSILAAGYNFGDVRAMQYKIADGVLLCFDVSRKETFDNLDNWFKEIYVNGAKSYKILLIGTKSDLNPREVTSEEAENFARKSGIEYIETSVKNKHNVHEVLERISSMLIPGELKAAALAEREEKMK